MKRKTIMLNVMILVIALCMAGVACADPMGTAFTYQGWLMDKKQPADGDHDFEFSLYDANDIGNQIGSTITKGNVNVKDGFFAVSLDFVESEPNAFNGDARWLQIGVRPGASSDPCDFVTLSPRQELTPTPYSLHTRGIFVDDAGNVDVAGTMVVSEWIEVGTGTVQINKPQNTITFTEQQGQTSGTIRTDPCLSMPLILNAGATGDIQLNPTSNGNVGIGTTIPASELDVNGTVTATAFVGDGSALTNLPPTAGNVPVGGIIMWAGTIANIPSGWALCDGNNGTPDLRDRFIVGARQDDSGVPVTNVKGSLMQMGGEHEHTLTIAEMPSHTHTGRFSNLRDDSSGDDTNYYVNKGATSASDPTGGGQPHENCPPFYALAFIMRL